MRTGKVFKILSFYLFIYDVFVSLFALYAEIEGIYNLIFYLFIHDVFFFHVGSEEVKVLAFYLIIYLCMYLLFMITRICLQELKILIILPTYLYIHVFCSFGWRNSKFHHFILISNMHVLTIYHICIAFILWWYLQSSYLFFLMLFLFLWLQEVRGSEL